MPAKREPTMRQIRQTLRLASDGISARQIGRMLGVARSTIQDNLKRAQVAGLAWGADAVAGDPVKKQTTGEEALLDSHRSDVRRLRARKSPYVEARAHKLSTKLLLLLPEQQRKILLPANLSLAVRTESR
jgi:IS30 family transposase